MANPSKELQLLAAIIDHGSLREADDAGITVDKLKDFDSKLIFEYLQRYNRAKKTKGNIPTRQMVFNKFKTIDLPTESRLTIDAAIEEFSVFDARTRLMDLADYIDDWQDEPDKVLGRLSDEVRELTKTRRVTQDIVLTDALQDSLIRYKDNRDGTGTRGIPYPWRELNDETRGMQKGEFIIFYGRPKSLKTWVALSMCTHAYDAANQRVLIYTREMSPEQMMDRTLCLLVGAPYDAFKKGYLADIPCPYGGTMEEAFYDLHQTLKMDEDSFTVKGGNKSIIITSDRDDPNGGGVMGLRRKMEDHRPDLTFVDAVYLMRNDRSRSRSMKWNDQAAISQDLKELAQDFKRPVLGTLQANRDSENRKGKTSANMSFSDSYGQDCDLAVEILKKRIDKFNNELALSITASREINMAGFAINGNPASSFETLMRPVVDDEGDILTENGKEILRPLIFEDVSDISKMFKERTSDPDGTDGSGRRPKFPDVSKF